MIPRDKIEHAVVGFSVAAAVYPFGTVEAALAVIAVALGKEIVWDALLAKGTPEPLDAVATMIGGALLLGWYVFGIPYL